MAATAAATTPKTPDRSYAHYLQDAAGGGGEEEDEDVDLMKSMEVSGVNTSGSSTLEEDDAIPSPTLQNNNNNNSRNSTPLYRGMMISPAFTMDSRSFVNGLLSPFSPILKHKEQREEYLQYVSLQPCRKVSVVVRVLPCQEEQQRCVFPHVKSQHHPELLQKPKAPRDMVVVNPSAFGQKIPSQVTMETARLVAQVAHISSEDWARLYEFHHVMWPPQEQPQGPEGAAADPSLFRTMDSLSQAVSQDALVEHQSSLVISMGQAASCMGTEDGLLWPKIISQCQALLEDKSVCTLSMVEILEDKDQFRDLLNRHNKDVSIQHVDMNGAIWKGLTQVSIDSMPALLESLLKRKRHHTSTVIATLSLWENAVSHELQKAPNAQITCVEMAATAPFKKNHRAGEIMTMDHRKSTVCLGMALRQLLLASAIGKEPVVSYREATLTKVLQRSMESSKIVLCASISQRSKDYEATVVTLNYLRNLLVQPGKMASSPFREAMMMDDDDDDDTLEDNKSTVSATPSKLQEFAKHNEHLLEKLVADPRQRLAKVFQKSSPAPIRSTPVLYAVPSQEDYEPTDYMQGLEYNGPLEYNDDNDSKPPIVPYNDTTWESPQAAAKQKQPNVDEPIESPNDVFYQDQPPEEEETNWYPEQQAEAEAFGQQWYGDEDIQEEALHSKGVYEDDQPQEETEQQQQQQQQHEEGYDQQCYNDEEMDHQERQKGTADYQEVLHSEEVNEGEWYREEAADNQHWDSPQIDANDEQMYGDEEIGDWDSQEEEPETNGQQCHPDEEVNAYDWHPETEETNEQEWDQQDETGGQEWLEDEDQKASDRQWDRQEETYGLQHPEAEAIDREWQAGEEARNEQLQQGTHESNDQNLYEQDRVDDHGWQEEKGAHDWKSRELEFEETENQLQHLENKADDHDWHQGGNGETDGYDRPQISDLSDAQQWDQGGQKWHQEEETNKKEQQERPTGEVQEEGNQHSYDVTPQDRGGDRHQYYSDGDKHNPQEDDEESSLKKYVEETFQQDEEQTESPLKKYLERPFREDNDNGEENQLEPHLIEYNNTSPGIDDSNYTPQVGNTKSPPEKYVEEEFQQDKDNRDPREQHYGSGGSSEDKEYQPLDENQSAETGTDIAGNTFDRPQPGIDDDGAADQPSEEPEDSRNTSTWLDDNEEDDGLEPQTEYDLPEMPLTRNQREETQWSRHQPSPLSSPSRLNSLKLGDGSRKYSAFSMVSPTKSEPSTFNRFNTPERPLASPERTSNREQPKAREKHQSSSPKRSLQNMENKEPTSRRGGPLNSDPPVSRQPQEVRTQAFYSSQLAATDTTRKRDQFQDYADNGNSKASISGIFKTGNRSPSSFIDRTSEPTDDIIVDSDQFVGEIKTLEGAVTQIQNMHSGLWKSSALSLHRLKDSLQSQQREMLTLSTEREGLLESIAALKDESKKTSYTHDESLQRYEEEVQQLQDRLEKILDDKGAVEKIADEAISAQDDLERQVRTLNDELREARRKAEISQKEYDSLLKACDDLREELFESRRQCDQLDNERNETKRALSKLELSVRRLDQDRSHLEQERLSDISIIDELRSQLRQLESTRNNLEKEKSHLEALRREDKSNVEGLQNESRRFGLSLDNAEKEKMHLEGLHRKDQAMIQELGEELLQIKASFDNLNMELKRSEERRHASENRLETIETESRELSSTVHNLRTERDNLKGMMREENSISEHMQNEIIRLRQAVEDQEAEGSRLKEIRREDQITIQRLQSDLQNKESRTEDFEKLEMELSRLKKENIDIETLMARRKAEHFEAMMSREEEVAYYKNEMQRLSKQLSESREREQNLSTKADSEIQQLRESLDEYQTELNLCNAQRDDIALELELMEKKASMYSHQLEEKDETIERYRLEVARAKEELAIVRERENTRLMDSDNETKQMEKRIENVEAELFSSRRERDDAVRKAESESRARVSLSSDLSQAKDLLTRQKSELDRLSRDLERAKEDRRRGEEKISNMESTLSRFQVETKEKVEKVVNHHKDSTQFLESANHRNRVLEEENKGLERILGKLQRERDSCYRSLELGRERLATITSKSVNSRINSVSGRINSEVHLTGPSDVKSRVTAADMISHVPELYLTDYSADQLLSLRAEEIAACLAASARESLQESHEEASHLRSQVYRLEDEKEAEVASLKSRIRSLERELAHGDHSKGKSSVRRSRHLIDPSE